MVCMEKLSDTDRRFLLRLARSTIAAELNKGEPARPPVPLPPVLKQKRGCFVTLHKKGMLRGCIGTIEPVTPLVDGIAENAVNAAFRDPRFPPLSPEEIDVVHLEVSLLTVPEILEFRNSDELLEKLEPGEHGVILSKGWHRATFLPQVWEQLPDKISFLEHLCRKAGMAKDCWQDPDVEVQVYFVEHFGETD